MPVYTPSGRALPSKEQLIAFEAEIAEIYNRGTIKAPVHLSGGNEDDLIRIFADVADEDLIFTTWRSHYHCLLKGVPPDVLKAAILAGHSITLNFGPPYNVLSSAIVGGVIPIALGAAWALKQRGSSVQAWCFVGDMAAMAGPFAEAIHYADNFQLPLRFIVEDNGKSVGTPTREAWVGVEEEAYIPTYDHYEYKLSWPHAGAGKWVSF